MVAARNAALAEGGTPAQPKSGAKSGRTGCEGRLPSSVSLASGRSSVRSAAAITPAWAPRDEAPMGTACRNAFPLERLWQAEPKAGRWLV